MRFIYTLQNENGDTIEVDNLYKWCREHGMWAKRLNEETEKDNFYPDKNDSGNRWKIINKRDYENNFTTNARNKRRDKKVKLRISPTSTEVRKLHSEMSDILRTHNDLYHEDPYSWGE